MNQKIIIGIILLIMSIVAIGCTVQTGKDEIKSDQLKACPEDAKICTDGRQVGRNPDNNCEFYDCPDPNDKPIPVEADGGIGSTPELKYVSTDPEKCKVIRFMCIKGTKPFANESGCGCEPDVEVESTGKLKAFDCEEPRPEICTKEYVPVCGQVQVECIRAPCEPVRQTFGNKCEACANKRTISYTFGECTDQIK